MGLVGAAGLLTALVPGALILMTTATILARLITRARETTALREVQTARRIVPLVAIVSLWFVFNGEQTLVTLLLFAYAIVTQLFPSVLVSIWWPQRANAVAAFAGIVVGEGLVMYTSLAGITTASMFPSLPASITDMNIGVLALAANVLVLWLLTVLLPTRR
jgi:SSS family solute:Na+ symporter